MGVAGGTYVVGSDCPIFVQGRTTSPFYGATFNGEERPGTLLPSFLIPRIFPSLSSSISLQPPSFIFFPLLSRLPFCRWGNMFFYARSLFILLPLSFPLSASSSSASRNQENEILCAQFFFFFSSLGSSFEFYARVSVYYRRSRGLFPAKSCRRNIGGRRNKGGGGGRGARARVDFGRWGFR